MCQEYIYRKTYFNIYYWQSENNEKFLNGIFNAVWRHFNDVMQVSSGWNWKTFIVNCVLYFGD